MREAKAMNTQEFGGFDNWISLGRNRASLPHSRRVIFKLNKKYEQYGKLITLIPKADSWLIEIDSGVLAKYNADHQRITTGEPLTRDEFAQQREVLQKTFPGVEIVEDPNLNVVGRLMPDGKTIMVNPIYWTRDTLGHEFGHLLIDLIGGLNNKLVKQGLTFLEGSSIQKKVYETYSDLVARGDMDRVNKEILAQALGLETAKIFKEEFEMGRWERWLVRFFRRVRQLLGLESAAVRKLARRLVKGTPLTAEEVHAGASSYSQEQRIPKDDEDIFRTEHEELSTVERIRLKAIEALEKKIGIYKNTNRTAAIEPLEAALKQLEETENMGILFKNFTKFVKRQTNGLQAEMQLAEREESLGKGEGFSARRLFKWKDYVSAYGTVLEDIRDALLEYRNQPISLGDKRREKRIERIDERIAEINKILNTKAIIEQQFRSRGRDVIAKFLAPHSRRIEIEYKDRLERRYNQLPKSEKEKMSVEEYQEKYLRLDANKIRVATEQMLKRELVKAEWDINLLGRWLDSILDSPDPVVAAMRNAFMDRDMDSRWASYEKRNEIVGIQKKLEKALGAGLMTDQRKFYGFMLERDKKGNYTQHVVGPILSAMFDARKEFLRELELDTKLSDEEKQDKRNEWRNTNMPRTPADRKAWDKARHEFMQGLLDEGLINRTEYERIDAYEANLGTRDYKPLNDLITNENAADRYLRFRSDNTWNYRTPIDKWKSPQWSELIKIAGVDSKLTITEQEDAIKNYKGNDPRILFYNLYTKSMGEAQSNLPLRFRIRTRLPGIPKEFGERLRENQSWLTVAKESTKLGLTRRPEDIEKGQYELTTEANDPVNFIPIFYTNEIEEKNQSYDLATNLHRFWSMANDYALKAQILPEMEMTRLFVEEREIIKRDAKRNPIKDALSRQRERILTKKGSNSFIAAQFKDWFEAEVYGQREKDEGVIFGNVDAAKAANMLNRYVSLNLLGINMVQGVANVVLGQTLQWIEAAGGQHYGVKNFSKAGLFYNKNLMGIMGDVGERVPSNLISLMNEKFDTLNEYENGSFRKNSKFAQLMNTNTLFFTTHAGEHFMQTRVMLAMLDRMKALDKKGKEIGSMLDMLEKGQKEYVQDLKDKYGNAWKDHHDRDLHVPKDVANFGQGKQKAFSYAVKRVLAHIHGEYSQMGRSAIHRYAMGRMIGMFRKFIVPGYKRRWGKRQVNELLGEFTEGSYRTTGRFVGNLFKDFKIFSLSLQTEAWNELTRGRKSQYTTYNR